LDLFPQPFSPCPTIAFPCSLNFFSPENPLAPYALGPFFCPPPCVLLRSNFPQLLFFFPTWSPLFSTPLTSIRARCDWDCPPAHQLPDYPLPTYNADLYTSSAVWDTFAPTGYCGLFASEAFHDFLPCPEFLAPLSTGLERFWLTNPAIPSACPF